MSECNEIESNIYIIIIIFNLNHLMKKKFKKISA